MDVGWKLGALERIQGCTRNRVICELLLFVFLPQVAGHVTNVSALISFCRTPEIVYPWSKLPMSTLVPHPHTPLLSLSISRVTLEAAVVAFHCSCSQIMFSFYLVSGKQTRTLRGPAATDADEDSCFSILTRDGHSLDLEAGSPELLTMWYRYGPTADLHPPHTYTERESNPHRPTHARAHTHTHTHTVSLTRHR